MIRTVTNAGVPLVRLSAINPFLKELASRGIDAGDLLVAHGLPRQIPASSELFVSAHTMYELVEKCAAIADDRYLGATIGEQLDLLAWEPIADAAAAASSVGDLISRFIVNAKDHASSARYTLETSHDRATFRLQRAVLPPFPPAQNDAFYLGWVTRLLRNAAGERWNAAELLVRLADAAAVPAAYMQARVVSGDHKGFRIAFPAAWLFEPFDRATFVQRVQSEVQSDVPLSLVESVREALEPHIHEAGLTVARAARLCGLRQRHLSRRLKKEGTTLVREIARLRERKAAHELIYSDNKVADIAVKVGFTDATVFSRAFKNWTGQSPQAYRRARRST